MTTVLRPLWQPPVTYSSPEPPFALPPEHDELRHIAREQGKGLWQA